VGEGGAEVDVRMPGEVVIRGPGVTSGYLANDEANAEAFRDGWFRTGDLGYLDSDGYLFLVGRSKDTIVSGGINVYPAEIEDVLHALPGVVEAAVTGIPDPVWGESVKAVLVLADGVAYAPADIERHCRAGLAGYKVPRVIAFAGALPRTGSGKVLSRELAAFPGFRRTDDGWTAG